MCNPAALAGLITAVGRVETLVLAFQAFHGPSFPRLTSLLLRSFLLPLQRATKTVGSVPVSRMCARSVMRSSNASQSRAFGITCVHSENGRLVVDRTAVLSARSAMTETET